MLTGTNLTKVLGLEYREKFRPVFDGERSKCIFFFFHFLRRQQFKFVHISRDPYNIIKR